MSVKTTLVVKVKKIPANSVTSWPRRGQNLLKQVKSLIHLSFLEAIQEHSPSTHFLFDTHTGFPYSILAPSSRCTLAGRSVDRTSFERKRKKKKTKKPEYHLQGSPQPKYAVQSLKVLRCLLPAFFRHLRYASIPFSNHGRSKLNLHQVSAPQVLRKSDLAYPCNCNRPSTTTRHQWPIDESV